MEVQEYGKIHVTESAHRPETSCQTGFPSPATHYAEATIDLNKVLVGNKNATFFIRVQGNNWASFNIFHNDVLIIDRSLDFTINRLALVVIDGEFKLVDYNAASAEMVCWGVITHIIHKV